MGHSIASAKEAQANEPMWGGVCRTNAKKAKKSLLSFSFDFFFSLNSSSKEPATNQHEK
jgi:hypothetical protein